MIGKRVINRFKALFRDPADAAGSSGPTAAEQELRLAVAALMIEAAQLDDDFDVRERAAILDLAARRFGLEPAQSESLLAAAEAHLAQSHALQGYTRVVKQALSYEARIDLLEMLWEVVYTDGELHHYEASLMRRLAGLLQVSDRESGSARKRALARLSAEEIQERPSTGESSDSDATAPAEPGVRPRTRRTRT